LKKRAAHIDVEAVIEVLRRFRFKRGNRGNAGIEEHAVKVVNVLFDFASERLGGAERSGVGLDKSFSSPFLLSFSCTGWRRRR